MKYLYFYCNDYYIQLAQASMGEDERVCNINILITVTIYQHCTIYLHVKWSHKHQIIHIIVL